VRRRPFTLKSKGFRVDERRRTATAIELGHRAGTITGRQPSTPRKARPSTTTLCLSRPGLDRTRLDVGMTRGCQTNHLYSPANPTDLPGTVQLGVHPTRVVRAGLPRQVRACAQPAATNDPSKRGSPGAATRRRRASSTVASGRDHSDAPRSTVACESPEAFHPGAVRPAGRLQADLPRGLSNQRSTRPYTLVPSRYGTPPTRT
jgi:hypothetical protein